MKVIELFAGIGSQTQALKNIGVEHEVVGIAEIDKYAVRSYEAIHGEVNNLGDICKIEKLPECDLLTYSFPCQDLSVAGKGAGIKEGTRSGLLLEVERLLEVSEKPKYLLMENVKNLVGKKNKPDFDRWCEKLESMGYTNYWKILNAKHYGIPQNRERVFMISILGEHEPYEFPEGFDNGIRLKDLLEDEVDEKFYISGEKVEKLISQLDGRKTDIFGVDLTINEPKERDIANCVKARYDAGVSNFRQDGTGVAIPCLTPDRVEKRQNGRRFKEDGEPMFTLTGQDRHGVLLGGEPKIICEQRTDEGLRFFKDNVCGALRTIDACGDKRILEKQISSELNECIRIGGIFDSEKTKHQAGAVWDKEGMCPTLDTMQGGYRQPSVIVKQATKQGYDIAYEYDSINIEQPNSQTRRGRVGRQIANTLTCGCNQAVAIVQTPRGNNKGGIKEVCPTISAHSWEDNNHLVQNLRIRKLTPLECWRLMGFQDEHFYKAQNAGISNNQLYKQAGNSIVVDVLEHIFMNLFK